MNILIKNAPGEESGIYGEFFDENGSRLGVTLQHAFSFGPNGFKPKVPAGVYVCRRRMSPRFGFEVFELLDVPGATYIEIHPGNYNSDSDGCILLGSERTGDMIMNSKITFAKFMELQDNVNEFTLVIS